VVVVGEERLGAGDVGDRELVGPEPGVRAGERGEGLEGLGERLEAVDRGLGEEGQVGPGGLADVGWSWNGSAWKPLDFLRTS